MEGDLSMYLGNLRLIKNTIIQCYKKVIELHIKWKILIVAIVFVNLSAVFTIIFLGDYRNLVWLFYYSTLCNSPFGWFFPMQEPILMLYGNLYHPFVVALTAGIATFMIEIINYQILVPICNLKQLQSFRKKRFYRILEGYFNKIPFIVISFVGFTPLPHAPFRILAVLTKYSVIRYAIATFVGRAPFYYLVAMTGKVLNIPNYVYVIATAIAIIVALVFRIIHKQSNN
jgi:membrane protein YqaA with SNARE-associated domain